MFHGSRWHNDPRLFTSMISLGNGKALFVRDCVSIAYSEVGDIRAVIVKFFLKVFVSLHNPLHFHLLFYSRRAHRMFGSSLICCLISSNLNTLSQALALPTLMKTLVLCTLVTAVQLLTLMAMLANHVILLDGRHHLTLLGG